MQLEDIIQQKEWQQLTDAERRTVEPLAATEGEYNVLKKMLLIAREDADDVPPVSSSVQQQIHSYLKQPAKKKRMTFWYAAAASVIILVLAAVFLLQQNKPVETIAIEQPRNKIKPVQKTTDSLKQQVAPPINPPAEHEQTQIVKQKETKPVQQTLIQMTNNDMQRDIAQVNTSVSENESLLAFVTEVY